MFKRFPANWSLWTKLLLGVAWLAAGSPALAQPPSSGALSGYQRHEAFEAKVRELDTSDLVQTASLGKSFGGRDIWRLTVGKGNVDQKPAVVVVGSSLGGYLVGSELALRMAEKLANGAKTNPATAKLLDDCTFYFIPRPDPDTCEKCFALPFYERPGNDRVTDDDRDFAFGEDPPNDLNQDGYITQMRVEDESGKFFPHPDDPRILIEADPAKNERGKYRVLTEGRDEDGDGQGSEDAGGGVSLSRNFPHQYKPFSPHAGTHAASESETRAVADFLFSHPNIALVFSFSTEENLFHPWKPNGQTEGARIKTTLLQNDSPTLEFLAEEYRKLHGGKEAPQVGMQPGSLGPWAYFGYGRVSLVARGWWVPKVEPPKVEPVAGADPKKEPAKTEEKRGTDELNLFRWMGTKKIDGFVNWTPIVHPDFPGKKVEIGGFKPFYTLNPPADELDTLAEKHFAFLGKFPGWMPKLSLAETKVEPLGSGLFRLSITVANTGFLPTMTEMGKQNREAYPVQLKVAFPADAQLLQGSPRVSVSRLEGLTGKVEKVWLVRFPGEIPASLDVTASGPTINTITTKVLLK